MGIAWRPSTAAMLSPAMSSCAHAPMRPCGRYDAMMDAYLEESYRSYKQRQGVKGDTGKKRRRRLGQGGELSDEEEGGGLELPERAGSSEEEREEEQEVREGPGLGCFERRRRARCAPRVHGGACSLPRRTAIPALAERLQLAAARTLCPAPARHWAPCPPHAQLLPRSAKT